MIQVPPNASVIVMHEAVSFRNGIEGTAAIARVVLKHEPMDGALFVFRNKQRQMLRLLFYDGQGFWLCTKRLSKGRFSAWPTGAGESVSSELLARELQVLLWAGDPRRCEFPALWRKVG